MQVKCKLRCKSPSKVKICACTLTSNADVGSSQISILGDVISARAIATRCRCPPDSCEGYEYNNRAGKRTISNISRADFKLSALDFSPRKTNGRAMISANVRRGLSDEYGSWKIGCTNPARLAGCICVTGSPANKTDPVVGASSPSRIFDRVDLPDPLSPTKASVSPR